jgi:hypothetical protein
VRVLLEGAGDGPDDVGAPTNEGAAYRRSQWLVEFVA